MIFMFLKNWLYKGTNNHIDYSLILYEVDYDKTERVKRRESSELCVLRYSKNKINFFITSLFTYMSGQILLLNIVHLSFIHVLQYQKWLSPVEAEGSHLL